MDLKKNTITVGELLENPGARRVMARRFPFVMKKPPTGAALTVTLEQLIAFVQPFLSEKMIRDTLAELKKI